MWLNFRQCAPGDTNPSDATDFTAVVFAIQTLLSQTADRPPPVIATVGY